MCYKCDITGPKCCYVRFICMAEGRVLIFPSCCAATCRYQASGNRNVANLGLKPGNRYTRNDIKYMTGSSAYRPIWRNARSFSSDWEDKWTLSDFISRRATAIQSGGSKRRLVDIRVQRTTGTQRTLWRVEAIRSFNVTTVEILLNYIQHQLLLWPSDFNFMGFEPYEKRSSNPNTDTFALRIENNACELNTEFDRYFGAPNCSSTKTKSNVNCSRPKLMQCVPLFTANHFAIP